METIKPIILLLVAGLSAVLISCTHNEGDIGPYFGTWKLTAITVDGEEVESYSGNIFWQFQASVFCMRQVDDSHGQETRWASWYSSGDSLYLDFSHEEDEYDNVDKYKPFGVSGLGQGLNRLEIMTLSGRKMTLEYVDPEGTVYRYSLTKWK